MNAIHAWVILPNSCNLIGRKSLHFEKPLLPPQQTSLRAVRVAVEKIAQFSWKRNITEVIDARCQNYLPLVYRRQYDTNRIDTIAVNVNRVRPDLKLLFNIFDIFLLCVHDTIN